MNIEQYIDRLLTVAGHSLGPNLTKQQIPPCLRAAGLTELLTRRNGFFALHHALHVFPCAAGDDQILGYSFEHWNDLSTWKWRFGQEYQRLSCFAEDIFGQQFAVDGSQIVRFDPETGIVKPIGPNLKAWIHRMLVDTAYETCWPLAEEWQVKNRPLAPTERLYPIIPFSLGGEYQVQNLLAMDAEHAMSYHATIWEQVRHLAPGTKVKLRSS